MSRIDGPLLARFLALAGERLAGDWVILGGVVLPLLGIEERITFDIDIAGPDTAGNLELLELMGIAEDLGLPVEAINLAGAFFLRRIEGWRDHLLPLHRGHRARLLRPDATLYLLLKVARLSETDLSDCRLMLHYATDQGEAMDDARILGAIDVAQRAANCSEGRAERLGALRRAVTTS